jgi:hypothetical protein
MRYMGYKAAREMLIRAGFTAAEIEQLTRLRREYLQKRLEQHDVPIYHRQSRFMRWFMQVIHQAGTW